QSIQVLGSLGIVSIADLHGFDVLARRAIDPALDSVAAQNDYVDYVVKSHTDGAWTRTHCALSIRHTSPTMSHIDGRVVIRAADNCVVVEHHFQWHDQGRPILVATINTTDVTKDRITSLARDFVAEFFHRIAQR